MPKRRQQFDLDLSIIMATLAEIRRILVESESKKGKQRRHIAFKTQLRTLLERADQGIWEWNAKNNLLLFDRANEIWNQLMGYTLDEIENSFDWWFEKLHPESQEEFTRSIRECLKQAEKQYELEMRVKSKSGDWVWFWTRGLYTDFDDDDSPTKMIGVYRLINDQKETELKLKRANQELEQRVLERTRQLSDANRYLMSEINQRKRIEENLQWAKVQAESANRLKTEFLANISHELRTPLHHILNYAKFGAEKHEKPREQLLYYFRQIRKSSKRLENLLNDLLDLSSLELGKTKYRFKKTYIHLLVADVVSEMGSVYAEKSIIVSVQAPSVSTYVTCDERKISQVIYNLLSNAIKFSPEGSEVGVTFGIGSISSREDAEKALKVSFTDQGVGVPTPELGTIFSAFTQSSRTNEGAGGTGLGLSISKQIIHDHRGKIWAENSPEGGARFSFLLPYKQEV